MKTLLLILFLSMLYPGKRQVLIFYNNESLKLKDEQLNIFHQHQKDMQERDIEIRTFHIKEAKAEVKQWNISSASNFTFILVGKDGGEKLRADTVVSTGQLFATIDAMPMRKQEMKDQK